MRDFFKIRLVAFVLSVASISAFADGVRQIDVMVLDRNGKPLQNVLVMSDAPESSLRNSTSYEVEQVNMAFSPKVLVVPSGSKVTFPNTDTVAHHVYSFSKPNHFTLPLYRGETPAPVTFEHSGVIVLGCNIHDHMVGHIIVTDNQEHTWTDENGMAAVSIYDKAGDSTVRIWHPRIRLKRETVERITSSDTTELTFQLVKRLLPEKSRKPKRSRY